MAVSKSNASEAVEGHVATVLQARHFEWLVRAAAQNGRSVEKHLEWIIRQAYAADPLKAGLVGGGGSVPAQDFRP